MLFCHVDFPIQHFVHVEDSDGANQNHRASQPEFRAIKPTRTGDEATRNRLACSKERVVHIEKIYPGERVPLVEGEKKEALDLQGLRSGGDSWTRTNDPIDVNDVLYRLSHATTFSGLKNLPPRTTN